MESENHFTWLFHALAQRLGKEAAAELLRTYQDKLILFVANEKLRIVEKGERSDLTVEDSLELLGAYLQEWSEDDRYSKGYQEGYQDGLRKAGGDLPLSA